MKWPLIIACAVVLTYIRSVVLNDFIGYDDYLLITGNPLVLHPTMRNVWAAFSSYDPELYVPLTTLSLQLTTLLFGAHAWAFHAGNAALHMGAALASYFLLKRMTGNAMTAGIAALLWAVHPLNAEAVAWAAARKDVLCGMLSMCSLNLFARSFDEHSVKLLRRSFLVLLLALLSKPLAIVVPAVMLLLLWQRNELDRAHVRALWPAYALSAIFLCIAFYGKTHIQSELSLLQTVLLTAKAGAYVLLRTVLPLPLSIFYEQHTPIVLSAAEFFVPLLLALCAGAATMWGLWKRQLWAVLYASAGVFLLPIVSTFEHNHIVFWFSDRYAYLPLFFLLGGTVVALHAALHSRVFRAAAATLAAFIACGLMILSAKQTAAWFNSSAIFTHATTVDPQSAYAWSTLGLSMLEQGNVAEGKRMLEHSLTLRADPYVLAMLGNAALQEGDAAKAEELYKQSIAALPRAPFLSVRELKGYWLYGLLRQSRGDAAGALALYLEAVERSPGNAEAQYNAGITLQLLDRSAEAKAYLERAITLAPRMADAHYHLAGILAEEGDLRGALAHLRAVLRWQPNNADAARHVENIERLLE